MMNRAQAEAYGKKMGCKYYVYNSNGGLFGGFQTREAAEECKRKWENDRWAGGIAFFIKEVR